MDPKLPLVLVVEDDDDFRLGLAELLEADGYRVVQAANGFDAMVALEHQDVSLMILDFWMPHFNGREVLAYLDALGVAVPVVMISADQTGRAMAEQHRVEACLRKPIIALELMRTVRNLISRAPGPRRTISGTRCSTPPRVAVSEAPGTGSGRK